MANQTRSRKASRGTPIQTELAHEFDLHEYAWPAICGESRDKWRRVAEMVDRAARDDHTKCGGVMADGRTVTHAPPFTGAHEFHHKHVIRMALVSLLNAGIPTFLTEKD